MYMYRLFHASYVASVPYQRVSAFWSTLPVRDHMIEQHNLLPYIHNVAVISNMAFETLALRKEIRTFRGIEAMVKVLNYLIITRE